MTRNRTFLVLIVVTITSFFGKMAWDKRDPSKSTGSGSSGRKKRSANSASNKDRKVDTYDPEVGRGSFFDD
ncbi:hypothetical protein VTO58DRAFT_106839 [Aureobasidium pullulans]|nr:hypothetical protein JADG_007190 [Aureobasidium pullulans]KAG2167454.1 hypothetical protein JADG_007193 [Aureobasidium pullulans]